MWKYRQTYEVKRSPQTTGYIKANAQYVGMHMAQTRDSLE